MTKSEFNEYMKTLDIKSKSELADLLNVSFNTANGWNGESKPYPSWLESWFINYGKALELERLVNPEYYKELESIRVKYKKIYDIINSSE